jgi:hypothetical protein
MLAASTRCLALAASIAALAPAQEVRFNRDVRPILSDRCFQCHGVDPKARKAGLRLDTWEGLTTAIEGRVPVRPGDPDASSLIQRVEDPDPARVMPPPSTHKTLSAAERQLLRRWIEQGAPFEEHWAFVPPTRPAVPAPAADSWSRTPIDRFVLARLRELGLEPQPEADRETLIRRVFLDLTGLPPSVEDLAAHLADEAEGAHERLVDRVLASPHFGERMAQVWLDAARYADTNGFHHDNVRTGWPYRDWVIEAFDRNLPYDRFVIEQLAGDLLPGATEQQRIATAFCRMHNINDEGGAIDAEYRVEALADRVETVATAFMGLTMTCARCHDHKYDPLTQDDYYSLFAVFGTVDERGVNPNSFDEARAYPARLMHEPPELKAGIAAAARRLDAARDELAAVEPAIEAELQAWAEALRRARGLAWVDAALVDAGTKSGAVLERLEDGSLRHPDRPETEVYTLRLRTTAEGLRLLRVDALADPRFHDGRVGLAENGNAVVSSIRAEAVAVADPGRREPIRFAWAWADHEQPNGDFDVLNAAFGQHDGWALEGHLRPGDRTALLCAAEPFGFPGGTEVVVTIACESRYPRHVIGRPRVALAQAGPDLGTDLPLVASGWWLAGPFGEADFEAAWQKDHGPEAVDRIDRGRRFGEVGWQQRSDADRAAPIALSGERSAFYLAKELRVPRPMRVPISLGSDDAIQVFVDGRKIHENRVMRGVAADQERLELELEAGEHVLVVKVVNGGGPAGFFGRIDRAEGAPEPLTPLAWLPPETGGAGPGASLLRVFGARSPTWLRLDGARREAEAELASLRARAVPVLVMQERSEPAGYQVLTRGQYDAPDPARPVRPRPPTALGGTFPDGARPDRLAFARWLTAADHPLTARVQVNRVWQMLFGRGIVASQEDFGQQAAWPSHPELLDWLATTFVADGWDQKALIRRIVLSAVYRQRAVASPESLALDPDGRLLSRFPRRRLAGEFVRDLALAASGLLVDRIGGPSVRPYQPDGLWREVSIGGSSNTQVFRRDQGEALYRRSLYTFWKRTSPNPQLSIFDAPTRESCVVARSATNTPLQALVLWNDEQFVEAARALAARVLREEGEDEARLERLFRLCTGRRPGAAERALLGRTLAGFAARYRAAPEDALALVSVGASPPPADFAPVQLAPWTMLASTVLNLDETLVRD